MAKIYTALNKEKAFFVTIISIGTDIRHRARTKFEDLPEDFECPLCGVGKDNFSEAE